MHYRPFTNYENYIYVSRYARWLEKEGRRERWPETVQRVITCFKEQTGYNPDVPWDELHHAILNRDVMPSMRVMMTAGRALDQNHIAAYNCSFLDVNSLDSFSEALYVLMHGTGLGFSVRQESIRKLPVIPDRVPGKKISYSIDDSKEGWRDSVRAQINCLRAGVSIEFDYSRIRPEGARLRTFGGRASGPAPLKELHEFLDDIFTRAAGRRLTTEECHSIMCKIGAVVVVGGVRRSALISLSDLDDKAMAEAKSGEWWVDRGHYALANNTAVYEERPCKEDFDREWDSLRQSGSGERGIFNRDAQRKKFEEIGRKQMDVIGLNPCAEILLRDGQLCNLSEVIVRPEDNIGSLTHKVAIATLIGTIQSTFDDLRGLSHKWRDNTREERLLGVSMTGIFDNDLTNGRRGTANLIGALQHLRSVARDTNTHYAEVLGVNPSAAITAIKPSGTVSQLCGTSSGIHPAHANSYIRRVRGDKKDPLTRLLREQGVPGGTDFYNDRAYVFEFGIRRPNSVTRDQLTAIEFLKLWSVYQEHYCDHNPSVTVSVKEEEWEEVGDFVYENFDSVCGISFLPFDGGSYSQPPYETSDELPEEVLIDFTQLSRYETDDETTDELGVACASGVCEI